MNREEAIRKSRGSPYEATAAILLVAKEPAGRIDGLGCENYFNTAARKAIRGFIEACRYAVNALAAPSWRRQRAVVGHLKAERCPDLDLVSAFVAHRDRYRALYVHCGRVRLIRPERVRCTSSQEKPCRQSGAGNLGLVSPVRWPRISPHSTRVPCGDRPRSSPDDPDWRIGQNRRRALRVAIDGGCAGKEGRVHHVRSGLIVGPNDERTASRAGCDASPLTV